MATLSKWLNSPTIVHTGKLSDVRKHVPSFERRPFALSSSVHGGFRDNTRLDAIVRLPLNGDADCIPVGVVSKDYALVPHTEVLREAERALEDARIDPADVDTQLTLTEYGERMALSLRFPDTYQFDPGDSFPMTLRFECFNSVDGSTRFRALMGWFRLVCSNGLTIGVTRSASVQRHVGDIRLEHIGVVLEAGMNDYERERERLVRWRKMDVEPAEFSAWVDKDLKAAWGFKAAARAFHIAGTGRDVDVIGPYKGHTPTNVCVERAEVVPGSPQKSTSLFDISQVLAWLAKERRDIHEQLAWREQIPALMESLAE